MPDFHIVLTGNGSKYACMCMRACVCVKCHNANVQKSDENLINYKISHSVLLLYYTNTMNASTSARAHAQLVCIVVVLKANE